MKLNINCIRDIMLKLEEMPYNSNYYLSDLTSQLSNYSKEEIEYSCLKLDEAGYIKCLYATNLSNTSPDLVAVFDITYSGHLFLNNVRSNTIWSKLQNAISKFGSAVPIPVLNNVATALLTQCLKTELNLP